MAAAVDFFFYGTLRDADVRDVVMGPCEGLTLTEGHLPGYRCAPVDGGRFPGVARRQGAAAPGVLIRDASLAVAARLSFFEGDGHDYDVQRCRISTCGAQEAWVFLPTGRLELGPGTWDIEVWRRRYKAGFVANAETAMRGYTARHRERHLRGWETRLGG